MKKQIPVCLVAVFGVCLIFNHAGANETADRQLFQSIKSLDLEGAKQALSSGADPNALDAKYKRWHPLGSLMMNYTHGTWRDGVKNRREVGYDIATLLLSKGARISRKDNLLFYPVSIGDLKMLELLLDHGANIFQKIDNMRLIEYAVYYDQVAIVKLLEEKGARVPDKLETARLRLQHAISSCDFEEAKEALENGATVNELLMHGITPLMSASGNNSAHFPEDCFSIFLYLLNHGANPNKTGKNAYMDSGESPLHVAVMSASHVKGDDLRPYQEYELKKIRVLLENGSKISHMNDLGQTPLHFASIYNNVSAAEILLSTGCRVMPKDNDGKTPLDYAESSQMISLLKEYGAVEMP